MLAVMLLAVAGGARNLEAASASSASSAAMPCVFCDVGYLGCCLGGPEDCSGYCLLWYNNCLVNNNCF